MHDCKPGIVVGNENRTRRSKMEKLSRRKALMALAAAGAGAAVAGAANAQSQQDNNLEAHEQRLPNPPQRTANPNDRLQGAAARWVAPPDPDRPAFETLLT